MVNNSPKILLLDCDSTLSAIEGIDALAALHGEELKATIEQLTHDAMEGRVPLESVFSKRLEQIAPTRGQCSQIGRLALDALAQGVPQALESIRKKGWDIHIVSGGLRPVIAPIAKALCIKDDHLHAVGISFDDQGNYAGYDHNAPTARSGGKPLLVTQLKQHYHPALIVMVGDGVSDLETKDDVDCFIAFKGFIQRQKVVENADYAIHHFEQLLPILDSLTSTS